MANQGHKWQQGESGNPKGRPPKHRAMTAILERAGSASVEIDGKKITGKHLIARLVWEAATTGFVTFPGQAPEPVPGDDWFDVVKWLYTHIDGPAKQGVEITGRDGGPMEHRVDFGKLSDAELDALVGIAERVASGESAAESA